MSLLRGLHHRLIAPCLVLATLTACASAPSQPARGASSFDVLLVGNAIHLLIVDVGDRSTLLSHARSDDGGYRWSPPVRVPSGLPPGDQVRLTSKGDELIARWRSGSASSLDGGRTWRAAARVDAQAIEPRRAAVPGAYPGTRHALRRMANDGVTELQYIASADDGKTWWIAIKLARGDIRSSDLVRAADGMLAAVWEQGAGTESEIHYALSLDDGRSWSAAQLLSSGGTGNAVAPRVVPNEDGFLVMWLESWRGGPQVFQRKVIEVQHRHAAPPERKSQDPHKSH